MDRFILLKRGCNSLLCILFCCLLQFVLLPFSGCGTNRENGGTGEGLETTLTPTNTPAPNTNYLSVMVNGSLYGEAKRVSSAEISIDENRFLGEVTKRISPSRLPENDLESNTFDVGARIYSSGDDDSTIIVVIKENEVYGFFVCKKRQ